MWRSLLGQKGLAPMLVEKRIKNLMRNIPTMDLAPQWMDKDFLAPSKPISSSTDAVAHGAPGT
eukprot:6515369-Prorocentrum_lima.AAC.1